MAKKAILILLILCIAMSCKKVFVVEDISQKELIVNAPHDSLSTSTNLVTFWWEPLDGAEKYNLQIVEPTFQKTVHLILDTNVTVTKLAISLQPGVYQWRIRGTNAGHATKFSTFNLTIDTTSNLSQQYVNRISPANGSLTGSKVVLFSWTAIGAAEKYELQINEGMILDTLLTSNEVSFSLPAASGANTGFTWKVKAINQQSQSPFNPTAFTFTVDLKVPAAPSLVLPFNNSSVADTTKLVWLRNGGSDVDFDSVYVATDSTFQNIISQSWSDVPELRLSALDNAPLNLNANYWWRVRSFDLVKNKSAWSVQYKFKLVP